MTISTKFEDLEIGQLSRVQTFDELYAKNVTPVNEIMSFIT